MKKGVGGWKLQHAHTHTHTLSLSLSQIHKHTHTLSPPPPPSLSLRERVEKLLFAYSLHGLGKSLTPVTDQTLVTFCNGWE